MSTTINVSFHGVGVLAREREPGERHYWVTDDVLKGILDLVVDRPQMRVSFDDGNASDLERALPCLMERGLTATFFVLAGRLDTPGSLSTADVRALGAAGMRIGTHGMDHVPWPLCDDSALWRELAQAREVLGAVTGRTITDAACPLGRYDRRVLRALRQHGYSWVGTSDRRPAREAAWLQPRFSVRSTDTPGSFLDEVTQGMDVHRRARQALKGMIKRVR